MKNPVINADDFGYSKIFNAEILKLAEQELISSTSVMINRIDDSQKDQVEELKSLSEKFNIGVGLHLEFSDDNFQTTIKDQYQKFISIFDLRPDFIDLHKTTFLQESYPPIIEFCKKENLPCRNHGLGGGLLKSSEPEINGTSTSLEELISIIKNFEDGKSYEIVFHPGAYDPDCKSSLNKEREKDVEKIKKINSILEEQGIELVKNHQPD